MNAYIPGSEASTRPRGTPCGAVDCRRVSFYADMDNTSAKFEIRGVISVINATVDSG